MEPTAATLHELIDRVRDRAGAPFRPEDSPLHGRCIFVVGAPRSGTTWLHQLLAQHPDVATAGESHIFADGVSHLLENHRDPDPWMHLSTWLPASELETLVRALCDGVFERLREAQDPSAARVLDKSPNARPYAADLARIYPDATFIHIVRDARDMAGSARDLWGWSERFAAWEQAATTWVDAVQDNRDHLGALNYLEIRYEDLLVDTVPRLTAILDFAALDHDPAFVEEVVAFGRAPVNVRPSDTRIGVAKWQGTDRDAERRVVRIAGGLLVDLGYLSEAERRDLLAGTTAREAWSDGRTVARGVWRRATGVVRDRREQTLARRRYAVREVGGAVAEAVLSGDRSRLAGATIETAAGTGSVADLHLGAGATITTTAADDQACLVQFRTSGGARVLHRYFIEDGRVTRVVVQR